MTLTNQSGTQLRDAETKLVAGQVQLAGDGDGGHEPDAGRAPRPGPRRNTGPGEALGDYYIYALPERTTIAQNQTKQVSFLDAQGVSAHKVYEWSAQALESASEPSNAAVAVDFANSTGGGLGAGPAGRGGADLRARRRRRAEVRRRGRDRRDAAGLRAGAEVRRRLRRHRAADRWSPIDKVSKTRTRYSMSYLVRNAKSEPVTVELRQGGYWGRDTKVVSESLPSRRIDAGTLGWSVPVPANGQTTLTSVVETGW